MCVYTAFWQELQPLRLEQVGVSMALIWEFFSCHDFSQIAQTEVAYLQGNIFPSEILASQKWISSLSGEKVYSS